MQFWPKPREGPAEAASAIKQELKKMILACSPNLYYKLNIDSDIERMEGLWPRYQIFLFVEVPPSEKARVEGKVLQFLNHHRMKPGRNKYRLQVSIAVEE